MKKLRLSRQSIRQLDAPELGVVVGGLTLTCGCGRTADGGRTNGGTDHVSGGVMCGSFTTVA